MKYEFLFISEDRSNHNQLAWKKGYPVIFHPEGWNWGAVERHSNIIVRVECSKEQAESIVCPVYRETLYEILDFNPATDSFKVKIYPNPENVLSSGEGSISVESMEEFLVKWGTVLLPHESDVNDIRFTLKAIDVLNGQGYIYFDDEDDFITFTELEYEPESGTHRILADFSLSKFKSIRDYLIQKRCTVESEDQDKGEAIFSTSRDIMREHLEQDVRDNFDRMVSRTKKYLNASYVDSVVSSGRFKEDSFENLVNDMVALTGV